MNKLTDLKCLYTSSKCISSMIIDPNSDLLYVNITGKTILINVNNGTILEPTNLKNVFSINSVGTVYLRNNDSAIIRVFQGYTFIQKLKLDHIAGITNRFMTFIPVN